MPQPKRQSSRGRATGARKSGSPRQSRSTGTARKAAAVRKTTQQRKAAASRRSSTARRPASARTGGARRGAAGDDVRRNVQNALEALSHGVVLTRDRLQEAMDEAVERGRMTRGDANNLVGDLLRRGRDQTHEVRKQVEALRSDVEQLLGRAGGDLHKRAGDARRKAMRGGAGDRALREVDRARRAAGLGKFPILNYEDLTAAQVSERLADLSPAQLRKVRDHERRNANRKSVLSAIERALG